MHTQHPCTFGGITLLLQQSTSLLYLSHVYYKALCCGLSSLEQSEEAGVPCAAFKGRSKPCACEAQKNWVIREEIEW